MRDGFGVCVLCGLLLACGGGGDDEAVEVEDVVPGDAWATASPEAHGFDSELLQDAADVAGGLDSHCFMVVHRGTVIGEWYWDGWDAGTTQEIFSASKSVASTLVGIAQDRGLLSIDERASDTITQWQGTDSEAVTIRNLLSNDSGRQWSAITDYVNLITLESDKTAYAVSLGQQHPPGEHWEYNNAAIQTLEPILEAAVGMPVADFAEQALFEPLGMDDTDFGVDAVGNATMWQGVQASCADLARFGLLFLRRGLWADDEVIVSEAWVTEATVPSTELNSAYGYLWWLNYEGSWQQPAVGARTVENGGRGEGRWLEADPEEIFMALGFQGQMVAVDPTSDTVFVRIGGQGDNLAGVGSLNGGLPEPEALIGATEVRAIREAMRIAIDAR